MCKIYFVVIDFLDIVCSEFLCGIDLVFEVDVNFCVVYVFEIDFVMLLLLVDVVFDVECWVCMVKNYV